MTDALALVNVQSVTFFWYVVRGSGFVVYVLLTLGVILGLTLSLRWRSDTWPRIITEELHRYVQLVAGIFLLLHILSTLLDSFVKFQLFQVLVPFTSGYRVIWMSAGIVSMYLAIALYLSVYVRRYIGYRTWRAFHYGGFAAWMLALVHGIATGTDTKSTWALVLYGGSAVIVAGLLAMRAGGVSLKQGVAARHPRVLPALAGILALGALLTNIGPLQSGWAARAGGAPVAQAGTVPSASQPPANVSETVSGTAASQNRTALQPGTELLHMQLQGNGSYPLTASYGLLLASGAGGAQFVRGVFSLAPKSLTWTCSGSVTFQPPNQLDSSCTPPGGGTLQVITTFSIDNSGSVSGQIRVSPGRSQSSSSHGA